MISPKHLMIACAIFSAALASPFRGKPEQSGIFQLYAYSASVAHGGMPLFYDEGMCYRSDAPVIDEQILCLE